MARDPRPRPWARLTIVSAITALGMFACVTEPVCRCSEPGSRVVVYGVVTQGSPAAVVADVGLGVTLGSVTSMVSGGQVVESRDFPTPPAVDNPAPVRTDLAGRYRLTILSTARERRCLAVAAAGGLKAAADLKVTFGPPGEVDSVRVDLVLTR